MTSFVNVCDVISAEKRYACLKMVNNKTKMNIARFISSMPWVTCGQEKGVRLKGFISLEELNLSRQKQNYGYICLINHGIFPPNMYTFIVCSPKSLWNIPLACNWLIEIFIHSSM